MTRPPGSPEDLFRAEKERARSGSNSQHARLLAEAKAAFDKLMAEGQAARKSGRPRKHPLPPLKTSSSRTPSKFAPPQAAAAAKPATPVAAAPPPVVKESKPAERAVSKHQTLARPAKARTAKARKASAKSASSKAKAKAKRSNRR